MSSTTLPVCPKTGSTSPSLTVHLCLHTALLREIGNAPLAAKPIGKRIEAATASRELAEEQLQAEESKFEVGLSTNFFVLQSQRDLATAQDAELRAILDYQRALIEFERTQRAFLGGAGIALVGSAMESGPVGPTGGGCRRGRF